jgi:hypothetical protein
VWLNGGANPVTTLNAGGFLRVETSRYTGAGNLHILTSEPVFVYQIIGGQPSGDDAKRTAGLTFVPPISCAIPNAVDNIYQPNSIGDMSFDGGLMIVGMKDSTVTLRINGQVVALGTGDPVLGNPDFVTYRRLNLFSENTPVSNASVVAQGAVQVGLFGRNGAAGFGAFYSGFSKVNAPKLLAFKLGSSDGICPDTLLATGKFDGVQWYYQDSLVSQGTDSFFVAYAPGQYIARAYLGVCSRTDFVQDTVEVGYFDSPAFPYTVREPSCFGFENGQVVFGTPTAGKPPFEYSVDNGFSFDNTQVFNGIAAGDYTLVARDAAGCYNRPIDVSIGQPDSLGVDASILRIEEPVKPGESVLLGGEPSREIVSAEWQPLVGSNGCLSVDCLQFTAYPEETTWYTITVTDSAGCSAEDRVQVVIEPNVYAPNVIWPGSSQGNDRFVLSSKENLPVNWLRIYDRWGSLVFENQDFSTNDASEGWDGSLGNRDLSPGVFVFVAEVEYATGRILQLQGDVLLMR